MVVELKNKRFYITLPKRLFNDLLEWNKKHERMDLDLAALILHFILKQQSEPQEWVPLSSVILRKYDYRGYKSSEHIKLLLEGKFIELQNHQNNIPGKENSCRTFRVSLKYFEQEKKASTPPFHAHEIRQRPLLKKVNKYHTQKKVEAESTTHYLTKWLESEGFSIDKEAALDYIQKEFTKGEYTEEEYQTRRYQIDNFTPSQVYSRDGDDDRLHSTFTWLARDLKKFVTYREQPIIEVDIKSSQPIMLAILLDKILAHYNEVKKSRYKAIEHRLKNRILKTLNNWINNREKGYHNTNKYVIDTVSISHSLTIILSRCFEPPDFSEMRDFISLVKSGSIYECISESLLSSGSIWKGREKYETLLFNKQKKKQQIEKMDTLRNCGKQILLNALYSPVRKGSINAINQVKEQFPSVFRIINAFKVIAYKDLSLILQRMEAKCVLDHCAKNIAKRYPNMPLICRHDSLSTTEQFGDTLFDEFKKQVESYFGTPIKVEKDVW